MMSGPGRRAPRSGFDRTKLGGLYSRAPILSDKRQGSGPMATNINDRAWLDARRRRAESADGGPLCLGAVPGAELLFEDGHVDWQPRRKSRRRGRGRHWFVDVLFPDRGCWALNRGSRRSRPSAMSSFEALNRRSFLRRSFRWAGLGACRSSGFARRRGFAAGGSGPGGARQLHFAAEWQAFVWRNWHWFRWLGWRRRSGRGNRTCGVGRVAGAGGATANRGRSSNGRSSP